MPKMSLPEPPQYGCDGPHVYLRDKPPKFRHGRPLQELLPYWIFLISKPSLMRKMFRFIQHSILNPVVLAHGRFPSLDDSGSRGKAVYCRGH